MAKHLELGKFGESIAAEHLKRHGYEILKMDFHMPFGQLDIIARDGRTIVFVEVKTRQVGGLAFPEDAVTVKKKRKLLGLAYYYLNKYNLKDCPCRFDVVSVSTRKDGVPLDIRLFKDAFWEG